MSLAHQVTPPPDLRLKIKKIAVFTDFSKGADAALEYAAIFARANKASITLAHAYVPPIAALTAPEMPLAYQAQILDDVSQNLESRLRSQTKSPFLYGINCSILLHIGGTQDLLEALSDADLIVIGTSGGSGLEKVALGSTAEAVFRSSTVPVFTVGPHCPSGSKAPAAIKTVLYATDFSPGAEIALPYAVSIASEHEAKLVLLHVKGDKDAVFSFERAMASAEPLERLQKLAESIGSKYKPVCVVGFGTPDAIILEEAQKHKADLIVMGARGSGALSGIVSHFGGGTAYKVAAHATCPVLTIRK
jgi:nucleotide-binding universal stress UspA family protein